MRISRIIGLGLAASISFVTTAFAENVTLRYSSWLPAAHHVNQNAMYPWFQEIEKVTEGRVKVEILPKVVGTAQSQFDVIRDGLADVSFIVPGYTPGRFPVAEIGELPFLGDDTRILAPAFNRMYRRHMAGLNEFAGVEVMSIYSNGPGHVFTRSRPLKSVDDFKGLKLRATGPVTTELLNMVGAVPILKASNEAFEMLSTGVIDGSLSQSETLKNMKMIDLMKFGTLIPGGIYHATLAVIVNSDTWGRISPQDQQAINAVSHEKLAEAMGLTFYNADADGLETMKATPTLILETASPDFIEGLKKALSPLDENWIRIAKEKGLADPAAVLAELRAEVTAAEQQAE